MKKTKQFRELIQSNNLEFILEAHNGLSAKIVEEAGFKGIWAGGLSISAALGLRDNNEASWTQILEVIEFMSDSTQIPLLLDGDTGFGDFNNVRRLIKKLEQRHIAGVCIEDKLFPKTNSFFHGEQQPLADMDEFCGKIKAGKDTQTDNDFCIVARVEALITGWGMDEALKRAHAYAEAGADAILIHSKKQVADEVFEFMRQWDNSKPVIIVPTTYCNTPTEEFEKAGISLIVWANHILRSSLTAMQNAAQRIYKEQSVEGISQDIASVKEIFRIQNMDEFKQAENLYRPKTKQTKAIILAASRGEELGVLTEDKPKCMVDVHGQPILSTLTKTLNDRAIKNITAVVGYKKEAINLTNVQIIENKNYATTGILQSLYEAKDKLEGDMIISYGDILFSPDVLRDLLDVNDDIVLTVDTAWIQGAKETRLKDIVFCEQAHSHEYLGKKTSPIVKIVSQKAKSSADGEWIGLVKLTDKGVQIIKDEMETFRQESPEEFSKADLVILFSRLLKKNIPLTASYSAGRWLDVDCLEDLSYADQSQTTEVRAS